MTSLGLTMAEMYAIHDTDFVLRCICDAVRPISVNEMIETDDVLQRLLTAPKIGRPSLSSVSTEQGVYVLWLSGESPACLKVGIAGPRQGKGLRARLRNHFLSHTSNSVLARHLAADCASRWCRGQDFTNREQRQNFLSNECYFQAVPVETNSRRELERLEATLIARLQPAYVGRVGRLRTSAIRITHQ